MHISEGFHTYYIYIITNKFNTVFYTGVTNNLRIRLSQHAENITTSNKTFASKYKTDFFYTMKNLLGFKEIKGWTRDKKIRINKNY
ncbi:GIY-YIG nuclease family protein [Flavobacterium anhuiense]|uniref:GIY-YIG nuclease family protein n=1 Tax=Flavobacterium anhuiense TaxID=459526 RepID=UPI003D976AB7